MTGGVLEAAEELAALLEATLDAAEELAAAELEAALLALDEAAALEAAELVLEEAAVLEVAELDDAAVLEATELDDAAVLLAADEALAAVLELLAPGLVLLVLEEPPPPPPPQALNRLRAAMMAARLMLRDADISTPRSRMVCIKSIDRLMCPIFVKRLYKSFSYRRDVFGVLVVEFVEISQIL